MPYHDVEDPAKLLRLIDAVLMIEAAVELPVLLRHLVEEACSLVDARYGALGVLNEARTGLDPLDVYKRQAQTTTAPAMRPRATS